MQTENKGNMKCHWKEEAESTGGSGAEDGGAGKQVRSAARVEPMEEERTNSYGNIIFHFPGRYFK